MGCASSRPVPHSSQRPHKPQETSQYRNVEAMTPHPINYGPPMLPQPPPPTARGRTQTKPQLPYNYSFVSQTVHEHGQHPTQHFPSVSHPTIPTHSTPVTHHVPIKRKPVPNAAIKRKPVPIQTSTLQPRESVYYPSTPLRDVSPPRNRNEMPRRRPTRNHRSVSPLGSSSFERPARVFLGQGKMGSTEGCSFRHGGIGSWEHY